MNFASIKQANTRLEKARDAVLRLQNAASFADIKDAWTDFLLSASAIYSKLEQGAKADPRAMAWFGRVKFERKNDQLLSYIHHARNADEHGIDEITGLGFKHTYGNKKFGTMTVHLNAQQDGPFSEDSDGNAKELVRKLESDGWSAYVSLAEVRDSRFNDTFAVPEDHLGTTMLLDNPRAVAEVAIGYLEAMVISATHFLPPTPQK